MAISEKQDLKVGKYVKSYLHNFFNRKVIPNDLLANLKDKEYSKEMIGLTYPLLIRTIPGENYKEKVSFSGGSRYWTDKMIKINGEYYYICNDWYEGSTRNNRTTFNKWINQIENRLIDK